MSSFPGVFQVQTTLDARAIVSLFDMLGLTFSARALATTCLGELVENLQTKNV
jgi:hypothetical protein